MEHLDKGPVQVREKVAGLERNVRASKVGVGESLASGSGHGVPVIDPVRATDSVRELEFMVRGERSEVLHLHVVALPDRGGSGRVAAVPRCRTTQKARVGIRRVVDPHNDTLPVVTVASSNISINGVVLGKVPSIHNGKFAPVPGGTGVDLALVGVTTSATGTAAVLKTTAASHQSLPGNYQSLVVDSPGVSGIINRSVWLAAMSNVQQWGKHLNSTADCATLQASSNRVERVMVHHCS